MSILGISAMDLGKFGRNLVYGVTNSNSFSSLRMPDYLSEIKNNLLNLV